MIVGVDEADMAAGKISIGAPVALAMLGATVGDEVVVRTPARGREIIEITKVQYKASSAKQMRQHADKDAA